MCIKKGDRVLVWSLQSFQYGGFLKGEPAFVRQTPVVDSVFVCVVRNYNGTNKVDDSYEVYIKQVEKVPKECWHASEILRKHRKKIMKNEFIW